MSDAIKLAIDALEHISQTKCNHPQGICTCEYREALAALRAQPASQYLCNATRFKVAVRNGDAMLPCLPDELGGRWVALVAAEDDCHLRAQPDHSELVKRLRNFDFGSSDVDQWIDIMDEAADALEGKAIKAAAQDGLSIGVATKTKTYGPTSYNPVAAQIDEGFGDACYEQAVDIVKTHNKASISLVQRKLFIGYNRAARLLEHMEKAGVVVSNGDGTYRMPPAIGEAME